MPSTYPTSSLPWFSRVHSINPTPSTPPHTHTELHLLGHYLWCVRPQAELCLQPLRSEFLHHHLVLTQDLEHRITRPAVKALPARKVAHQREPAAAAAAAGIQKQWCQQNTLRAQPSKPSQPAMLRTSANLQQAAMQQGVCHPASEATRVQSPPSPQCYFIRALKENIVFIVRVTSLTRCCNVPMARIGRVTHDRVGSGTTQKAK